MSSEGPKISFALGGGGGGRQNGAAAAAGGSAGGPAPMSNLAKLMAQAQAKSSGSTAAGSGSSSVKGKAVNGSKPKSSIFGDDDEDNAPQHSGPSLAGPSRPKPQAQVSTGSKGMSRAEKRAHEEALKVDATVFDYDGVYDGMKAAERSVEQAKKQETLERKPKYTESFLAAAQTRKLDRLRAEEKMLQLEREKEGGEFDDKDKFVTEAYKKQMEEVRKAEEEERIREEEIRKSKKGPGLTAFYQTMLDDESKKHAAAVAASHGSVNSGPNLSIRPPTQPAYEPEAEYDPTLAREANQTSASGSSANENGSSSSTSTSTRRHGPAALPPGNGDDSQYDDKTMEINDEGEVVNKRSLLKAGLNITKKPSATLPDSLLASQKSGNILEGPYKSRAVGTAATYTERMNRERKRLAEELRLDAERKRQAEEEAMRAEEEAARKRREGDDGEALRKREEAKARFLERKRAREAEKGKKKDGDGDDDNGEGSSKKAKT